jgi:thiamine monophosphate synthase
LTLALKSLKRAVSTNLVDLVIVRVDDVNDNDSSNAPTGQGSRGHQGEEEDRERRIEALIRALVGWSYPGAASYSSSGKGSTTGPPTFLVAASSSLPQRLARLAHGVHAKESHYHHHHHHRDYSGSGRVQPPESVDPNDNDASELAVLGTSVHSVESALRAVWPNVSSTNNSTDSSLLEYLLVGTCFSTPSHPEKIRAEDLEGPRLPGRVRRALRAAAGSQEACLEPGKEQQQQQQHRRLPWVLGIGGIDARNCGQIIKEGADGVAVIRAVLASKDPASSVRKIRSEMLQATITTNLPDVK